MDKGFEWQEYRNRWEGQEIIFHEVFTLCVKSYSVISS